MGYFVRAFCKAPATPSLAAIQGWLKSRVPSVEFTNGTDLESMAWTHVELSYKSGKQPIVVECNRDEGTDSLANQEAAEFTQLIGNPGRSAGKRRILEHLAATKFVISCQLPSDIDDDGYEANYQFLSFFAEQCGGVIQADGEGFYDGDKIIVKVG